MNTPWGHSDSETHFERGLTLVGTPSHGGFLVGRAYAEKHLSPAAIAEGDSFGGYLAYEEDCDASIILLELPQTRTPFSPEHVTDEALIRSLSYWHEGYLLARGITPNAEAVANRKAFDARFGVNQ